MRAVRTEGREFEGITLRKRDRVFVTRVFHERESVRVIVISRFASDDREVYWEGELVGTLKRDFGFGPRWGCRRSYFRMPDGRGVCELEKAVEMLTVETLFE